MKRALASGSKGAAARNITVYLWRNPANSDPNSASLVFHAFNDANDGLGSPYGLTTLPAVFVEYPGVQVGQTYHVVATLDGKTNSVDGRLAGELVLHVNGVEVARTNGVGRTYNHSGDVQIGRGNGLIHNGGNGDLGPFLGTLDEVAVYSTVLSPFRVAAHYVAGITAGQSGVGALTANRIDSIGNPNQVLVTFSGVVSPNSATNLANYLLKKADGTIIPILSVSLLAGDRTVAIRGSFGLLVNSNYVLTVYDVAGAPGALAPNPTALPFTFAPPAGTTYDFNLGLPPGFLAYGNATVTNAGGSDGSGFFKLTEAAASQNGAVILTERRAIDQVRVNFKARLANASATPGEGFAVTIASDLPATTYTTPQEGYLPVASPNADRLIVSFDNFNNGGADTAPSIAVKWRGVVLTNVLTGTGGIPALHNSSGNWTNVDINLKRGGKISVVYGNTIVITNLATGVDVIPNAQIGLGAATGANFETHWFDDLSVNFNDGEIGPVGIGPDSELSSRNVSENTLVRFSVVPTGAGPFTYRWYRDGSSVIGGTNRVLNVVAGLGEAGNYTVAVSNEFSGVVSGAAVLSVFIDNTPAAFSQLRFINGSLGIIRATFNEPVLPQTATNLATYSVNGLVLSNAVLSADGQTVTIKTSPQILGQTYTLQVSGLKDLSSTGNPFSGQAQAVSAYSYVDEVLLDSPSRYWRFDETNGTVAASQRSILDAIGIASATYVNAPALGQPSLVPNIAGNGSVRLTNSASQNITVPNGSDLNATTGPWTQKSFEFWFKAASVPAPGTTGNAAAGLFEQGAATRGLAIYLWRNPANANAGQADLVFNGWNNAPGDGGGVGSPWGSTNNPTYARHTISTGQTYHVVAVFDGNSTIANGNLILYVNGVEVARTNNVGRLFNHTSDIQIGRGNTLIHTAAVNAGNLAFFNGWLDEFATYSTALPAGRVATHYQAGIAAAAALPSAPRITGVRVQSGNIVVTWDGGAKLERSTNAAGVRNKMGGGGLDYYDPAMLIKLSSANAPTVSKEKVEKLKAEVAEAKKAWDNIRGTPEGLAPGPNGQPKQRPFRLKYERLQAEFLSLTDPVSQGYAVHGVRDAKVIADTEVRIRGEAERLGPTVPRGFLSVFEIPDAPKIGTNSSGRLELAQWITHPKNPLTARIAVNRIWQHLFGQGIVTTVDNFGVNGDLPSHPELLDHLANEFVRNGWSTKKLIRTIALSHAYRLGTDAPESHQKIDPANRFVWRHSPRRLSAEEVRDAILASAGTLQPKPAEGSASKELKMIEMGDTGAEARKIHQSADKALHRSVYLPLLRGVIPKSLEAFDPVEQGLVTGTRESTTVPTQALFLLNSIFVRSQSLALAERLLSDSSATEAERIRDAYRLTLGREPSRQEAARAKKFIAEYEAQLSDKPLLESPILAQAPSAASEPEVGQNTATVANPDDVPRVQEAPPEDTVRPASPKVAAWMGFTQSLYASAEFRFVR